MRKWIEFFVSWRYLRSPRQEGFVAVIAGFSFVGIVLGVATLIIVMSVMNGFRHELMQRILGFNGHVTLHISNRSIPLEPVIEKIPEIHNAAPMVEQQGLCISPQGGTAGVMVRGLNGQDLQKRSLIAQHIVSGALEDFKDPQSLVMGFQLAKKLGLVPGQWVKIMTLDETEPSAFGMVPRTQNFRLVATFDSGMQEYDATFIFMPLKSALSFFQMPYVQSMEIFLKEKNLKDLETVQQSIHQLLEKQGYERSDYQLWDWKKINSHFFKAIQVQSHVMFLILTLIVLVAVFNVISCLVMLVKDKTKDIAILRTLGASKGMIIRIFFLTGAWIGVSGTAVGTLLGLGFAANIDRIRLFLEKISHRSLFQAEIYFLSSLPSRVDLKEVVMVIIMALTMSFLATLYPAWKASRMDPVQGLRYQ